MTRRRTVSPPPPPRAAVTGRRARCADRMGRAERTARVCGAPSGFSLVEVLVVLSVVVVLSALLVVGYLVRTGPESRTADALDAMHAVADAYETETGVRNVFASGADWSTPKRFTAGELAGQTPDTPQPMSESEKFCWAMLQNAVTRDLLLAVGREYVVDADGNGYLELRDGWGQEVRCAWGDPLRPGLSFQSAGPDGVPGTGDDLRSESERVTTPEREEAA